MILWSQSIRNPPFQWHLQREYHDASWWQLASTSECNTHICEKAHIIQPGASASSCQVMYGNDAQNNEIGIHQWRNLHRVEKGQILVTIIRWHVVPQRGYDYLWQAKQHGIIQGGVDF